MFSSLYSPFQAMYKAGASAGHVRSPVGEEAPLQGIIKVEQKAPTLTTGKAGSSQSFAYEVHA